jgi:pyruvate dehydrogenase E1 component alpha subunit
MPGVVIDGQDVVAVYKATAAAVERARRGEGPSLIEAKTYRFRGHYEGDPQPYRSKEEVERWKQRDPLVILTKQIVDGGAATQKDLDQIKENVRKEVDAAFEEYRHAPKPSPDRLFEYIYA